MVNSVEGILHIQEYRKSVPFLSMFMNQLLEESIDAKAVECNDQKPPLVIIQNVISLQKVKQLIEDKFSEIPRNY